MIILLTGSPVHIEVVAAEHASELLPKFAGVVSFVDYAQLITIVEDGLLLVLIVLLVGGWNRSLT